MTLGSAAFGAGSLVVEDEAALWRACKIDGSSVAREQLFLAYLPFARRMARRCFRDRFGDGVELGDFTQLACAGLLEAIDHFDPARGIPFPGYATRRVRGSILDGMAKMSEVSEQISFRGRVRQERVRSLAPETDEPAQDEALDALIDVALGLALGFMLEGTALYVADDAVDRRPSPYDSVAWREAMGRARTAIESLPARERSIVNQHYLEGIGFDQIAALLGLTKGRVSQLHRAALQLLKKRLLNSQDFRVRR